MAATVTFCGLRRHTAGVEFPKGTAETLLSHAMDMPLRRFDRSEIPEEAFLTSGHKSLPEFLPINGQLAVCGEARNAVETLEPDVHQFFPVRITRAKRKKSILDEPGEDDAIHHYYIMVPQIKLDAIIIEKSSLTVHHIPNDIRHYYPQDWKGRDLTFSRSLVDGHHVWQGDALCPRSLFFSARLAKEVRSRKWKGLDVVDGPEE